jgi:hypothetical protein
MGGRAVSFDDIEAIVVYADSGRSEGWSPNLARAEGQSRALYEKVLQFSQELSAGGGVRPSLSTHRNSRYKMGMLNLSTAGGWAVN